VVRILRGQEEDNPYKPDYGDRTPFSFATLDGHEGVVEIPLERQEVNRDQQNTSG